MIDVYAGIVLFNPDIARLKENIDSICNQVKKIILVDNGSSNIHDIKSDDVIHSDKIMLIENSENHGIAKALNQIMYQAKCEHVDWVLTLDQDSVCPPNLISEYQKYTDLSDVAMISARMVDRNINNKVNDSGKAYEEIDRCITSATLNRVSAIYDAGMYDEDMFIDFVDYDMCTRLRIKGYKIIRINTVEFLHEVGKSKVIHILGRSYVIYNHAPIRKYYYTRNVLHYMKKYKDYIDYKKEKKDFILHLVLVVLFEKNKIENIKNIRRGYLDYKKYLK